jgi:hypothetical protein
MGKVSDISTSFHAETNAAAAAASLSLARMRFLIHEGSEVSEVETGKKAGPGGLWKEVEKPLTLPIPPIPQPQASGTAASKRPAENEGRRTAKAKPHRITGGRALPKPARNISARPAPFFGTSRV